ncbi:hypothetical protein [Actinomadura sp. WMMA1423]|uniref:hypothetical protein n=1 Tax=Actinomadura sp. WMMA1423 TaxID=2591108 RepID=UPI001146CF86|nr:hypothetical protein [Actinomadura sp. WMMA1423]
MAIDAAFPTSDSTLSTMAQWEKFFTGFSADGVIPGVLNELAATLNTGARTAVLGTGAAQIRGFHVDNPSTTATSIPAADAQNRIDRLALRLDRTASAAANWIKPVVIKGTPATSPAIPALSQTGGGNYDIPIARWTAASNGSLSGLTDERVFAAAPPVEFRSGARPAATLRRVGFERDTGKVLFADGSVWRTIYQPPLDQVLTISGSGWSTSGAASTVVRRRGDMVTCRYGSLTRTGGAVSPDVRLPGTIPADFVPIEAVYAYTGGSGADLRRLTIYPSGDSRAGQIWFTAGASIPSSGGTLLGFSTSWVGAA